MVRITVKDMELNSSYVLQQCIYLDCEDICIDDACRL